MVRLLMMFFKDLFFYVCVSMSVYVHVDVGAYRDQKGASDSLEHELCVFVSCSMWVLAGDESQQAILSFKSSPQPVHS